MNDNWPWPTTESMSITVWTTFIEQDPDFSDECMIVFPPDLIDRLRWKEGDLVEWKLGEDGTAILTKVE